MSSYEEAPNAGAAAALAVKALFAGGMVPELTNPDIEYTFEMPTSLPPPTIFIESALSVVRLGEIGPGALSMVTDLEVHPTRADRRTVYTTMDIGRVIANYEHSTLCIDVQLARPTDIASLFGTLLTKLTLLTSIDLSGMRAECFGRVLVSIGNMQNIKHICLADCLIGDDVMASNAKCLESCEKLRTLDVSGNALGDRAVVALAHVVEESYKLLEFKINNNEITKAVALARAIARTKAPLTYINVAENRIRDIQLLARACRERKKLGVFVVDGIKGV